MEDEVLRDYELFMVLDRFEYVIMHLLWLGGYVCIKLSCFIGHSVYINLCLHVNIFNNSVEYYLIPVSACWCLPVCPLTGKLYLAMFS